MRHKGWVWVGGFMLMGMLVVLPVHAQPENFDVAEHADLAEEYMANKQWDYASFEWRRVLEVAPQNIAAHLGLSETLQKAGFAKDALTHMEKTVLQVKHPTLLIRLAELYESVGQMDNAYRTYHLVFEVTDSDGVSLRGIQRIMPKLSPALQNTARDLLEAQARLARDKAKKALSEKSFRKAAQFLDVASLVYDDPATLNDWAVSRFLVGQAEPALETLRVLMKEPKTPVEVQANLAMVALSLGDKNLASTQLEKAILQSTTPALKAKLYNNLGYVYEQSRNWTLAAGAYRRAIEADPTLSKAYLNLGYVYQRQKEYRDAIALYERFLQQFPGNAEVLNQLGFAYEMDYRYKNAISAYQKAIVVDPLYHDAYFNLATVYRKEGKVESANEILKKMTDTTFDVLEAPTSTEPQKQAAPAMPPLFKVIDVFFSPNVTQQAYAGKEEATVAK